MGSRGLPPWTDLQPRGEQELGEARAWQLLLLEPLLRLAGVSSPAQGAVGPSCMPPLSGPHRVLQVRVSHLAGAAEPGAHFINGNDLLSLFSLQ